MKERNRPLLINLGTQKYFTSQIQKLTSTNPGLEVRPSPTGVAGAAPVPARRRTHSTWLETDLDAMTTRDRGLDPPEMNRLGHPVYVNASGYVDEVNNQFSTC